ncbi:Protein of unknown function [Alteribacillus persepolensis]|uniref:DUF2515 domain-containing protein n=1 Tax=Alteribacillus persepolensis TaxID=568899 RepID=A0A1G8C381_9BACI|nr:DUF2515 family protein [Alteribacillus persepolensis]SDH39779.1 Protein of unknown function [Alteribacillus persepolensis]
MMLRTYKHLVYDTKSKFESLLQRVYAKKRWENVVIEPKEVLQVKEVLKTAASKKPRVRLTKEEQTLVEQIIDETKRYNRNNITRTEAYRTFYFQHPEVHWAFLAHMVSRNGGYCMTDVKGQLFSRFLSSDEQQAYFQFFERANALIFQDAYPQLRLYEESKKRQKSLFHLLPVFYVSAFMQPFWEMFFTQQQSALLTVALIINEQNYIEKRVIQQPYYQQHVLQSLKFKGQELIQLTQVVFPYQSARYAGQLNGIRLAGLVMEDFTDIEERINVGKQLYAMLFGIEDVFTGALAFALKQHHTASRSDYWPHMFSKKEKYKHAHYDKERFLACRRKQGAPPLYSPDLKAAWSDQPVQPPKRFDWFQRMEVLKYLKTISVPMAFDMTSEYCFGVNKMELGVLTKTMWQKHQ